MCSWLDTDLYINFVYHTVVIFVMETLVNRPYEPVHASGIHEYHELTCVCLHKPTRGTEFQVHERAQKGD